VTRYGDPAYCKAIQRYNEQGLAGLRDRRHSNLSAPTLLSDAQLLLMAQAIRLSWPNCATFRSGPRHVDANSEAQDAFKKTTAVNLG